MKHFLFRVDRQPKAHAYGTVRLWKIVKNAPVYLGKQDFNYQDNLQAPFGLAEKLKALPKRCFVENPRTGGYLHHPNPLRTDYQFHEV